MSRGLISTAAGFVAVLAALFLTTRPDNVTGRAEELPAAPDFIPSLYGYNHGNKVDINSNNQYRTLLHEFCSGRNFSQALNGQASKQKYATTIYNVAHERYREKADFYNEQIDWLIDCARKTGKLRVIINYNFYASKEQKELLCETTKLLPSHRGGCPDHLDGTPGYAPANIDDAMLAFDLLLGDTGPKNLEYTFAGTGDSVVAGISLAEENVTWDYRPVINDGGRKYVFEKNMRSRLLDNLYSELKSKYGKTRLKFLQWYSPHRKLLNYPGLNDTWPLIGSDGWVFDQYSMQVLGEQGGITHGDYYKYTKAMRNLGKPLYGIVWASPLRYPASSGRKRSSFDWWDDGKFENREGGWKTFYAQVAVNQLFQVHTLYYALTADPSGTVDYDVFMTQSGLPRPCGRDLFDELVNVTLPYVRNNSLERGSLSEKPGWILSAPKSCDP